jgi:two-component system response regulator FlrC
LPLQAKLLRAIQEREIDRIGGARPIPVDVRIVATSNRDLGAMVRRGEFRADLYYRLNVFPIVIPPLRERRDDVPALAERLVEEMAREMGRPAPSLDDAALAVLRRHDFPGNVRELRNVLERALVRCHGPVLGPATLRLADAPHPPAPPEQPAPSPFSLQDAPLDLAALERLAIAEALRRVGGNRTHAARLLGIGLRTLRSKLRAWRETGVPLDAAGAAGRQPSPCAHASSGAELATNPLRPPARISQKDCGE